MQIAIYDESSNLLDLTTAVTEGGGSGGQPVLTNSDGIIDPSLLALPSAVIPAQRTVTTTTTVTQFDGSIFADATTAAFTVTLLNAVSVPGYTYTIKKIDSTAHIVTVSCFGSQTIDGFNSFELTATGQYIEVQSNGANWHIVGESAIGSTLQSVPYAPTATLDFDTGPVKQIVLTGDVVIDFSGGLSGPTFTVVITQDGTGNHNVTFGSNILGIDGGMLVLTANTSTLCQFVLVGSNYYLSNQPISGQ